MSVGTVRQFNIVVRLVDKRVGIRVTCLRKYMAEKSKNQKRRHSTEPIIYTDDYPAPLA